MNLCLENHNLEISDLKNKLAECNELIADLVAQSCGAMNDKEPSEKTVDSQAITTYARAIRYLASINRIKIDKEAGRRVIGHWITEVL